LLSFLALACGTQAAQVQSASKLTFGPEGVLFVADWKSSKIEALRLPGAAADAGKSFNFMDFDQSAAKALGKGPMVLQDVVARPGTDEAYVAVTYGPRQTPAILVAKADGTVRKLDLTKLPSTSMKLEQTVGDDQKFWRTIPGKSFTVTDMKWFNGKLYAAGLSNQDFSSSLRILPYPFNGKSEMVSVEMYHTLHNQIETRAPIRAMAFTQLEGKPYLLAAYLCNPW
jgi:hypothetical protein